MAARVSQYYRPYLAHAAESLRDGGRPMTPGSYLHYQLAGRAKRYADCYLRALLRALDLDPDVVPTPSRKGGTAYARITDIPAREECA